MEGVCSSGKEECSRTRRRPHRPRIRYCERWYRQPFYAVDLRSKYPDLTGKVAENALVAADITVNKNMVPFDSRSAFQTSGIRLGTAAMTTRGAKEDMMHLIAELIEEVLNAPEDEKVIARVREKVNATMKDYPLFAY